MHNLSRRRLFCACGAVALSAATLPALAQPHAASAQPGISPDQAIERLREGNRLFRVDDPFRPEVNQARRDMLTSGQQPFVALLGCADSRTPPEALFHAGLGEIFAVRVAGNSALAGAVGSLEYAVSVLRVPLIVVMGHEGCGAVSAAKAVVDTGVVLPGAIGPMVAPIVPAVVQAMRAGAADVTDAAMRTHAQLTARTLRTADGIISRAVETGGLKVIASYYSLDDGAVHILPD